MCAYKLRVSHQTVWNHVQARHFRAARVGRALFVEIKSVKEYYGREGARALGLGDWSDVFRTEAGEVHVKSAE
jgi:predicted Co/Zn/Cd cation transporter (cation efflux family)